MDWAQNDPDVEVVEQAANTMSGQLGIPIDGGWRIKINDDGTHYVDVLTMIYNYRIALTPLNSPLSIDRHWCYAGKTPTNLLRTLLCAAAWSGNAGTEPEGWNKNGQTHEWREPEKGK
jgi:hypothetical protein